MLLTLCELRVIVREAFKEDLQDDPELAKHSVYVPDDVKRSIKKWSRAMGLSGGKKKRKRSSRV